MSFPVIHTVLSYFCLYSVCRNYPSLMPQDLAAAWDYYEQNRSEIDLTITAQDENEIDG
ncbi:MAG: hypothetical protein H0X31_11125 [Nostocaceae cyanobacterium]|nr:hypothetical protein [Nostocaceae cyanobacterium]